MAEGWSVAVIEPQREAVLVTKSNKKPPHKLLLALGEWGSVTTLARFSDGLYESALDSLSHRLLK